MKSTITKIAGVLILTATIVITSCQKENVTAFNHSQNGFIAREAIGGPSSLVCSGTIPDTIQVPEGNKFSFAVYATGVQIYQVKQSTTDPSVYTWVNIAPSATLYLRPDFTNEVGIHYGGPSWQFTKGPYKDEKVVATKVSGITVDAAAVPWLLLKKVESLSTPGNRITYLQRVCTTGGLAPSTPANESNMGKLDSIPYTATYLFYEAKN